MRTNHAGIVGSVAMGAGVLGLAAILGCAGSPSMDARTVAAAGSPFDERLLEAAAGYRGFERVSDRVAFAPFLCRAPAPTPRPGQLLSRSEDAGTHGKKLYYLYVSDPSAYERISWGEGEEDRRSPVGQTLVKETWSAVLAPGGFEFREGAGELEGTPRAPMTTLADGTLPPTHARDGDRVVMTDEPGDLFIMLKLDPATPGTDEGWVYGVVSRDGREVKGAGMIESCIGCHARTGRDRLVGNPRSWPER